MSITDYNKDKPEEPLEVYDIVAEETRKGKRGNKSPDEVKKEIDKRVEKLKEKDLQQRKECQLSYKGWLEWAQIKTQEDWDKLAAKAKKDYKSGGFFIKWIGREREAEPELIATLIFLRWSWINQYEIKTAPEFMLLDCAFISYYHLLRINYLIGNVESTMEYRFFGKDAPDVEIKRKYGDILHHGDFDGYSIEDSINTILEASQPLLDRFNRMFIRNLKALRDLKRGNMILNIGNVGQMNVVDKQQINILTDILKELPEKIRKEIVKVLEKDRSNKARG